MPQGLGCTQVVIDAEVALVVGPPHQGHSGDTQGHGEVVRLKVLDEREVGLHITRVDRASTSTWVPYTSKYCTSPMSDSTLVAHLGVGQLLLNRAHLH